MNRSSDWLRLGLAWSKMNGIDLPLPTPTSSSSKDLHNEPPRLVVSRHADASFRDCADRHTDRDRIGVELLPLVRPHCLKTVLAVPSACVTIARWVGGRTI